MLMTFTNLFAFFQFVANVLDPMIRNLRHVEQAVGAAASFDEHRRSR